MPGDLSQGSHFELPGGSSQPGMWTVKAAVRCNAMAPLKGGKNSCKRACQTPGLAAGTPDPVSPPEGSPSREQQLGFEVFLKPPAPAQRFLRAACELLVPLTCCTGAVIVPDSDQQRKTVTFSDPAFLSLLVGLALLQYYL